MIKELKAAGSVAALCLLLTAFATKVQAQAQLLPLSHDLEMKLGRKLYFDTSGRVHTSMKQYFSNEVQGDSLSHDSLLTSLYPQPQEWQRRNWLYRKVFLEHLVEVNEEDYSFYLDFLPDLQIGKQGGETIWLNTRGIQLGGRIGSKFAFTSHFFEDQGKLPAYQTAFANRTRVVPGQGYARPYGNGGFDFGYSGGTLSYTPNQYLNLQLGYDKNFIGDGYRSLLLSDNSFNYPFFKATATLGKVRYMAMFAQFIDFNDVPFDDHSPYPKKYGVFHYLSWNATKRFSIGLFENVMWEPRGFEFSYLQPVMILRPTEYANGSPDKVLYGLNASYKLADRYVAYGQLMVNELSLSELGNRGSWANKQGVQLGIKGFDVFKIDNLNAQLETNIVRPYSYTANTHLKNYGHYGQPLAHPYGANFKEYLGIVNYKYKRFDTRLQLVKAMYGLDADGRSWGKDIYRSYYDRTADNGIFIGHGLKTDLFFAEARLAYVLNPKNNLRLEFGYTYRKESNEAYTDKQSFFNIGLRASFRNIYNDF